MGAVGRKEREGAGDRKDGKPGVRRTRASLESCSRRAGSPSAAGGSLCPQLGPQCLIAMQERKRQEMAQPHVFLHTATPRTAGSDHSLFVCVGRDEVCVGEGVKHKESGPVTHTGTGSSLCQLQAEVTALGFCRGAKLLENTIENKSPAKIRGG